MKCTNLPLHLLAVAVLLGCFAACAHAATIQIDGADYNWDGSRLASGVCRLVIDNSQGDEMVYIGTATPAYSFDSLMITSGGTPWEQYIDYTVPNYVDPQGYRWIASLVIGDNYIMVQASKYSTTDYYDWTRYDGYMPPHTILDRVLGFPGNTAFHSPLTFNTSTGSVTDYNPMPTMTYIPEPATAMMLSLVAVAALRRRRCSRS